MSDTSNTTGSAEEEGAYTDEHGTQADVEKEIATEGVVAPHDEGEYTDEHGAEDGHA